MVGASRDPPVKVPLLVVVPLVNLVHRKAQLEGYIALLVFGPLGVL